MVRGGRGVRRRVPAERGRHRRHGRHRTAAGDEISILSEPRQVRIGVAEDGWTVDAIDEAFDSTADGYELTRTERFL